MKMKVVKERTVHLQPRSSRLEQVEDTDSDSEVDIQLDPVSLPQEQETQVQEQVQGHVLLDPVQEIRVDAGAQGGEGEQQQQVGVQEVFYTPSSDTDTGVRRSGRKSKAPERFGEMLSQHGKQSQLSPRNRKRIKSLAAKGVPREEWRIGRQENLVLVLQKKPQKKAR